MSRAPLLLCCLALGACVREEEPPQRDGPDLTLEEVTLRHSRAGQLRVVARTPHLEMYRFSGDLKAADASVYIARSGVQLELEEVTGNLQAGVLTGHQARLEAPDGTRAHTARLTWLTQAGDGGVVVSDAGIELDRPGLTHTATSFSLDLGAERAEFTGPKTLVTSPP